MKKILSVFIAVLTFALVLTACGKQAKTPATKEVADAIKESAKFDELLELTDDNIGKRYYGIDLEDIEEYTVYVCSNAAIGDEIAVFKMKEADDVEDMLEVVRLRKQDREDALVDYAPTEADKVRNSVVSSNGNYVYLIVSSDKNAVKDAAENCF